MATNLKLENYSDRELLYLLNDLASEDDNWVETTALADRIGLSRNGLDDEQFRLHAQRCVSVRLGWIARLSGAVEKDTERKAPDPTRWRLTDVGNAVVKATISEDLSKRLLDGVTDFAALHALDMLSRRYRGANIGAANLMRREWIFGTHRKRRA